VVELTPEDVLVTVAVAVAVAPGAVTVDVAPGAETVVVAPGAVTVAVAPAPTVTVDVAPGAVTVDVVVDVPALAGTFCKVKATRSPGTAVLPRPVLMLRKTSSVPAVVAPIEGRISSGPPM